SPRHAHPRRRPPRPPGQKMTHGCVRRTKNLSQHDHEGTAMSALLSGMVALARGRVQTGGEWFREAAGLFRTPTSVNYLSACLAGMAVAAALAGDHPTADASLASAKEFLTPIPATFELSGAQPRVGSRRSWRGVQGPIDRPRRRR